MATAGAESVGKGRRVARRTRIPERRAKAFRAYLELLDTATWFRSQMDRHLTQFDLPIEQFRLLEMLYRDGQMTIAEAARRRHCTRQSISSMAERMAKRGWVRLEMGRLPATEMDEAQLKKSERGKERFGRRALSMKLTEEGEKFAATVIRRHAKLVYAFMRVIAPREMDRMSRTCQKIRKGDPFKLIQELMMEDVE
jgi:DNA-binding MarR family transcriptional regulator